MGAIDYQYPPEYVNECLAAVVKPGTLIGETAVTGPVYFVGLTEVDSKR